MFTKLLLTATVILVAWLVVRKRWRAEGEAPLRLRAASQSRASAAEPLMPRGAVKLAAYGIVVLMLAGTGFYLFQDWQHARAIVQLQVINVYTGETEHYEARRSEIDRRSFRTLDGRHIQIAEMERLIVRERDTERRR
ncbi:hypothetical protein [Halochromatium salexigens]|uniref:Antitermination protein NusG n=1 Tax=Halochromatium salexigens TaxID=49447 RepID=A0AAJ0UCW7_HALSE|nr:hypothetical protein [Halochromatium salexigens]MBK5929185.1 hypothetical protein [Halochromatium salexigens]